MPSNPDRIAARYTGKHDGQYHHGVPLRDLTAAEFDALPLDRQEVVVASPIYEVTPATKAAVTRAEKAEAAAAPVEGTADEMPVEPAEGGN